MWVVRRRLCMKAFWQKHGFEKETAYFEKAIQTLPAQSSRQ